jgi:hypothetical protein
MLGYTAADVMNKSRLRIFPTPRLINAYRPLPLKQKGI